MRIWKVLLGATLAAGLLGGARPAAAQTVLGTYGYTGADQSFTVPAGVTRLRVKLWGAGGGGFYGTQGGAGGFTDASFTVNSGDSFTVVVGQGGSLSTNPVYGGGGNAFQGASGGGRSAIRAGRLELVTAGGGGGASEAGSGGAGGGVKGQDGTGSGSGGGGTQFAGGSSGGGASTPGSQFLGGFGENGGGGGGGYFGGGGGGDYGGGGGGSAFAFESATLHLQAGGTGATPAGVSDLYYVTHVGIGGPENGFGGSGRVVILDDSPVGEAVPEPGALALFLPALGVVALIKRRRSA